MRAPEEIEGPLPAGRQVGRIEVRDGARVLATAPLVTAAAVPAPAPLAALSSLVPLAALTGLVVVAILCVVRILRARRRRRAPVAGQ